MKCETCGSRLILNTKKDIECQYCGKNPEDITTEMIEELLNEKTNM